MENFKELKQFMELMIAGQDDYKDYTEIFTLVTTLCYTMLEKYRRSIMFHRHLLNNLTIYCYKKQLQERAKLDNTQKLNCKCENCVVLKILNNQTKGVNPIGVSFIIFHKLSKLIKPDNISQYDLLTFLIWLAKGCNYNDILNNCQYKNLNAVIESIENTLTSVLKLSSILIKLPQEDYEFQNIGLSFASISGHTAFASIVGAIDTWKIKINDDYKIDKEYCISKLESTNSDEIFLDLVPSSLHFQAICNHEGLIIDLDVDFSQNMSNAEVLRHSPIYCQKLYPPRNYFIAGNNDLPCILRPISILTPYPLPMNSAGEAHFNSYHARLTGVTKKVFTNIYQRWRKLFSHPLNLSEILSSRVVQACAIIHNVCVLYEDSEISFSKAGFCFSNYANLEEAPEYEENEVDCEDVRNLLTQQLPKPMIVQLSFKPK